MLKRRWKLQIILKKLQTKPTLQKRPKDPAKIESWPIYKTPKMSLLYTLVDCGVGDGVEFIPGLNPSCSEPRYHNLIVPSAEPVAKAPPGRESLSLIRWGVGTCCGLGRIETSHIHELCERNVRFLPIWLNSKVIHKIHEWSMNNYIIGISD